ncbi:MAG: phosphoserine phosphatase SerB [Nitrospiria bacterium]
MPHENALHIFLAGPYSSEVAVDITRLLTEARTRLFDMDLVLKHGCFAFSILIDTCDRSGHFLDPQSGIGKNKLFDPLKNRAVHGNLLLEIQTVSSRDVSETIIKSNRVVTCLGRPIESNAIHRICSILRETGFEMHRIKTLARHSINCIEMTINAKEGAQPDNLDRKLQKSAEKFGIDFAVQETDWNRRLKRLIIFDMDSTLSEIEVIDELAKEAGVGDKVAGITKRAMNGELSFPEALRERVGLLKGLSENALATVYERMPYTPGVEKLFVFLKKLGIRTAVLSGGFDYFTSRVEKILGIDYSHSNRLEIENGVLTGRLIGDIVDGKKKVAFMEEMVRKEGITLAQVIAVGDGANDLPMIQRAGLGIAFDAKPTVRAKAPIHLSHRNLSLIPYFMGYTEEEIEAITGVEPSKIFN